MTWPRDGHEVLRVRARLASYWKAETLESFDGLRWTAAPRGEEGLSSEPDAARHPEWNQRVRVTIGDLRTANFIGAGATTFVEDAPRQPVAATAGSFVSGSTPLGHGDAYQALAYYPRPTAGQLRAAPTVYGPGAAVDLSLSLADRRGRPAGQVLFPAWE